MSTRRALAFSFLDRYLGLVLHTASAMVVARLLTPDEIGVYSVVMVMLGFIAVFRDFGAGQYLVQHRELTPYVMRVTWTLQFALGAGFALAILLGAAPLAGFFNDPRVGPIMHVLAFNFLITPFLAFPNAMLVRNLEFGKLAAIRLTGGVAHAAVAVGAASYGLGAISLAWANLITTLASIAMTCALTQLPILQRPTLRGLRQVASFGGTLTLVSLLHTLRTGSPEFLLGKIQGLGVAGLMSRAQGLVAMFQQLVFDAVGSVALPYFARELRAGNGLQGPFLRASELVLGLGMSFFAVLALMAFPIVRLLYGLQWDEAVEPCRWLALAGMAALPGLVCQAPLVAMGRLREVAFASAVSALMAIVGAAAAAAAGAVVVAQALLVANLAASVLWVALARRIIRFSWVEYTASTGRTLAVAAATALLPALLLGAMGWRPAAHPALVLLCLLPAAGSFMLAARGMRHELWFEIQRSAGPMLARMRGA